jgi:hypothetical protein
VERQNADIFFDILTFDMLDFDIETWQPCTVGSNFSIDPLVILLCYSMYVCPGGVAKWSTNPQENIKIRVWIPPGCKGLLGKKHSNAILYQPTFNDDVCVVWKGKIKALPITAEAILVMNC